jgi:hypothetical protein
MASVLEWTGILLMGLARRRRLQPRPWRRSPLKTSSGSGPATCPAAQDPESQITRRVSGTAGGLPNGTTTRPRWARAHVGRRRGRVRVGIDIHRFPDGLQRSVIGLLRPARRVAKMDPGRPGRRCALAGTDERKGLVSECIDRPTRDRVAPPVARGRTQEGRRVADALTGSPDADRGFNDSKRASREGTGLDQLASSGHRFEVDLAWRAALRRGFKVVSGAFATVSCAKTLSGAG